MSGFDVERSVAVVVARDGRLPLGAEQAAAEAGGQVIVVGSGTQEAARSLTAERAWWCDTGDGFQPAALSAALAPLLDQVPLIVLPSSPDGRDLGPRLAATLNRPFIARAISASYCPDSDSDSDTSSGMGHRGGVHAEVSRLDDQVVVPIIVNGPAVVTLVTGGRPVMMETPIRNREPEPLLLALPTPKNARGNPLPDPKVKEVLAPDPATMDLADAMRVLGGGAGLAAGISDHEAQAVFDLLVKVSAALGASAGATRVATDAGWISYERQIGTTGVTVDPDIYIAFGVSGATQHVGGLGAPRHIISVNIDPSCPMTAMADLGLITDGRELLVELARRFTIEDSALDWPNPGPSTGAERHG